MGGVASVTMHLQLSYLSGPGRAFRMQRSATEKQISDIVYQKYGVFLRISSSVFGDFHIRISENTSTHNYKHRAIQTY